MTTGREVIVGGAIPMSPAEVVENATAQAKLLMSIVEQTKCYQTISGKKYLQVEAWETIGAFNNVHAETQEVVPITRDGEIVGYQAMVKLIKNGMSVGGATMPCFFTENACKGKDGDAKHKACMSAAQTFATSKAYRMNYSYVAILGGYQPTPAEEMGPTTDGDTPSKSKHWCEEHQTNYFMKGKMKRFAHKIEGTNEWCNEAEIIEGEARVIPEEPEPEPEAVPEPVIEEKQTKPSIIDLDWLRDNLKILTADGQTAFEEPSLLSYMRLSHKGIEGDTVYEIASKLDKGAATHLNRIIQDALAKVK